MKKSRANYSEKILIQAYAYPTDIELEVAKALVDEFAEMIIFLAPKREKFIKTPDIKLGDEFFEIKSPKGKGKYTIEHAFKAGAKQSKNIVFNLKYWKLSEENAIKKIKKELKFSKKVVRIIVICKTGKVIDISK